MNIPDFKTLCDACGITYDYIAIHFGCVPKEYNALDDSKDIPDEMAEFILTLNRNLETVSASIIGKAKLLGAINNGREIQLYRFSDDAAFWGRYPEYNPLPHTYQNALVWRTMLKAKEAGIKTKISSY